MKRALLFLTTVIALSFTACEEAANPYSTAQIIGPDNTSCPCCGGFIILIDQGNNQATYRFFNSDLPAGSTILDNASYPISVELTYEAQSNLCNTIDQITITDIFKR